MDKKLMGYVKTSISSKVAQIEFQHPSHNSLPGKLLADLVTHIENATLNKDVNVILLRSAGERTFCAGASFDELVSITNEEEGKTFFLGFANVINAIRKSSKIVVARLQGKAVGGGVGLAAAADYCMTTKYSSIKLSELALGFGPFVIGPAVERKIGISAFSQMTINATEWQTAKWGKEKGLFQEVFESTEQLDEYLDLFLSRLADMNPEALSELKKIFWKNADHWDDLLDERAAMSGVLVNSEFTKAALHSFKNKA